MIAFSLYGVMTFQFWVWSCHLPSGTKITFKPLFWFKTYLLIKIKKIYISFTERIKVLKNSGPYFGYVYGLISLWIASRYCNGGAICYSFCTLFPFYIWNMFFWLTEYFLFHFLFPGHCCCFCLWPETIQCGPNNSFGTWGLCQVAFEFLNFLLH